MAAGTPGAGRVAQAEMRSANMGLLLRHLRAHGGRSRARLAQETGLSKATTSSLVTDLAQRGLVREGALERGGAVGRPGTTVALDGSGVAGIGIELAVDYASFTAVTLAGTVVREQVSPLDVAHLPLAEVLDRTATQLQRMIHSLAESGTRVAGITVSPPGIIDYASGSLRFAPNLGWRDVALVREYATRLSEPTPPIRLENDAKLAALAESVRFAREGVSDLVYLTGDVGVGAGIIADGALMRGWAGFSGEVGHLHLAPDDRPCNCGRTGCWETVVGLNALLESAAPAGDSLRDPGRPIEDRLYELRRRADAGDAPTLAALTAIAEHLAEGLAVLVDVLNPKAIVLGGYFAWFGAFIIPVAETRLQARALDAGNHARVVASELGLMAAARGGAFLALEDVFADPTLVPAGA
ncbi:ROK family transcriptional regulator [Propioniciclava soli]|uniref:ROK family transcriptional regulator n=1 Tax=Propioniciclava soli TaxID=2775081 RepID=UPI001E42F1BB|nr:ROK family transcriptional regulator [Propioniciclava soli]